MSRTPFPLSVSVGFSAWEILMFVKRRRVLPAVNPSPGREARELNVRRVNGSRRDQHGRTLLKLTAGSPLNSKTLSPFFNPFRNSPTAVLDTVQVNDCDIPRKILPVGRKLSLQVRRRDEAKRQNIWFRGGVIYIDHR